MVEQDTPKQIVVYHKGAYLVKSHAQCNDTGASRGLY